MSPELRKRMEEAIKNRDEDYPYEDLVFKLVFKEGAEWMHQEEVVPRDELIEKLRQYAMHWKTCDIYFFNGTNGKCSCGFVEICNDLEKFEKGGEG